MSSEEAIGISAEIRRALLAADEPLSTAEIFRACDSASTTTQVASMLHAERAAGRVQRSGAAGAYRYALTEIGRACAEDPRRLRSRSSRRVRGRPRPPPPAPEASAPRAPDPAGLAADAKEVSETILAALRGEGSRGPQENAADEERSARLAATVLAHWPTPIRTMPPELLHAVQASLAPMLAA